MEEQQYDNPQNKSIKGYQIVIIILALILGALSFLYYHQTRSLKEEFAIERDTLSNQMSRLVDELGSLQTTNDTISHNLEVEREKADSLLQRLQKERNISASEIRRYKQEIGTLRQVMRNFVQQIDSLNTLNHRLLNENITYRKDLADERLKREMADERADELEVKVRKGSVIKARNINLLALSGNDKEVTRASRAARLRVDFILQSNETATPGQRNVYAVIKGPDGYVMANAGNAVFEHEGDMVVYSATREVDYENQDLSVSLYFTGGGITSGTYKVAIYMDGLQIGSNEIILR